MKALAKLKDEARKHEAKEEWDRAIDAYVQVINSAEGAEADQELPLYNRVGDLYVRLGKPADAVSFYERAADQYAEAGLYNNAIALCNKALRYVPNRLELLRKLGQFSAAQGFITDARRWYLEYAERQIKAGHLDDAFTALEDFASVHEDVELRELLGRYLKAHARSEKAVLELRRAYKLRQQAGEHQAAEALKQEILAIDPNVAVEEDPPPAQPSKPAPAPPPPEIIPWEPVSAGNVQLPGGGDLGLETAAGAAFGADFGAQPPSGMIDLDVPASALPGSIDLTTTDFGGRGGVIEGGLIDLDAALSPLESELPLLDDDVVTDLPLLDVGTDDLPGIETESVIEEGFDLPLETFHEEEEPVELPLMDFGVGTLETEAEAEPEPLPLLDFEAPPPLAELPPFEKPLELGMESETAAVAEAPLEMIPEAEPEPLLEPEPLVELEPVKEPIPETIPEPEPIAEAVPEPIAEPEPEPIAAMQPEPLPAVEPEAEIAAAAEWEVEAEEAPPEFAEEIEAFEPVAPEPAVAPEPVPMESTAMRIARGGGMLASGDTVAGSRYLDHLHRELAASGQYRDAWEAADQLMQLDPSSLLLLQQRVDYAEAAHERALIVRSNLDLAKQLKQTGQEAKAQAAYQRVVELEPGNVEATAALQPPARKKPEYFDLSSFLDEDEVDVSSRFVVAEKPPTGDEERDFADMLSQFKQKVSEHISIDEATAHYDLGLAFKEMGLIDEAIGEFQTAMKGGEPRLKVYEELGQCFLLKQQYSVALNVLNRALQMPVQDEGDLIGIYYALGRAHEELGQRAEAKSAYERVISLDINFQDTNQRLAKL